MSKFLIRFSLILVIFSLVGFSAAFAQTESQAPETDQMSPTNIQKALTEAGFYTGAIDGIIGRRTRAAIRGFQEKHDLTVDGKCGAKTWEKLKAYLEEANEMDAVSSSPASSQESYSLSFDDEEYGVHSGAEPQPENDELKQKLVS